MCPPATLFCFSPGDTRTLPAVVCYPRPSSTSLSGVGGEAGRAACIFDDARVVSDAKLPCKHPRTRSECDYGSAAVLPIRRSHSRNNARCLPLQLAGRRALLL